MGLRLWVRSLEASYPCDPFLHGALELRCWITKLCSAGNWTQGRVQSRQEHYSWATTPAPLWHCVRWLLKLIHFSERSRSKACRKGANTCLIGWMIAGAMSVLKESTELRWVDHSAPWLLPKKGLQQLFSSSLLIITQSPSSLHLGSSLHFKRLSSLNSILKEDMSKQLNIPPMWSEDFWHHNSDAWSEEW